MIGEVLGIGFYNILEDKLIEKSNYDKKLMYNRITLVHNLSAIFFLGLSIITKDKYSICQQLALGNTIGFFLNDTFRYIKLNKYKISHMILIYHHIVASIYIYNMQHNQLSYWKETIFWAEISNIPTNIVYYYIQKKRISNSTDYDHELKMAKQIQLYVYGFIRVFILSYFFINEVMYVGLNKYLFLNIPLIGMGYAWTYLVYNNVNSNIKENNKKH